MVDLIYYQTNYSIFCTFYKQSPEYFAPSLMSYAALHRQVDQDPIFLSPRRGPKQVNFRKIGSCSALQSHEQKILKDEKTQGNFQINSSSFSKNSRFCQFDLIIFAIQKNPNTKMKRFLPSTSELQVCMQQVLAHRFG